MKEAYNAEVSNKILMESMKGAAIYGAVGNTALFFANKYWEPLRRQNWRLKLLLGGAAFTIGFAVYGDEATVHHARNLPWLGDSPATLQQKKYDAAQIKKRVDEENVEETE